MERERRVGVFGRSWSNWDADEPEAGRDERAERRLVASQIGNIEG